ncbi:MAG: DUF167 domain-containing protein [Opitutaceae bacterium]|nr:DUF167 domain-containing protein [Opitutaceae bacterium]MBP9912240.1 DUF167 domain-containing protein [Opitutaceae bacterium]
MTNASCLLTVKVVPNAPRSEIAGWLGEALKVKIKAPPVEGRANAVLCEFLAAQFTLPKHAVSILSGETSRLKRVRLDGLTLATLRVHLASLSRGK